MNLPTFKKLKRKASMLFSKIYYHNYVYKPTGIYNTCQEYLKAHPTSLSAYYQVYPDLVSRLSIPQGLYEAHTYLKPKLSVKTDYGVIEVENGRLYTDNAACVAIISEDNKMIADVSFSYRNSQIVAAEKNIIFQQKYFEAPKIYNGVVFTLLTGGSGLNNYGHWMIDVLPRLFLLRQSGLFDKVDYFLVPSIRYDYQRDTLALLGISPDKIIDGELHTHIQASLLIASTAPRGNYSVVPQWIIDFLRETFLPLHQQNHMQTFLSQIKRETEHNPSKQEDPLRIYISRKDSKIRRVLNEDGLLQLLNRYGFLSYELSKLSFLEKMHLFSRADVVVSATGAGLTNILFCKPGTQVLEIFNDGFIVGPFYDIAGKLSLDYHFLICRNGSKAKSPRQGQKEHIWVDLDQLEEKLKPIVKDGR